MSRARCKEACIAVRRFQEMLWKSYSSIERGVEAKTLHDVLFKIMTNEQSSRNHFKRK